MNRKARKYLIITLGCFFCLWGCEEFFRRKIGGFAGSYPFVEYWEIPASEAEVVAAIKAMKRENPDLQPPGESILVPQRGAVENPDTGTKVNTIEAYLKDTSKALTQSETDGYPEYWLYIDFYYKDTKEVVHTWTRPAYDSTITTFAFVGLSTIGYPGNERLINRDFWYIANKMQISKFKKQILKKLEEQLAKRNRGYVPQ